jgi:hypothetical protein
MDLWQKKKPKNNDSFHGGWHSSYFIPMKKKVHWICSENGGGTSSNFEVENIFGG